MPVTARVVSCNETPWTRKNFSRYFRSAAPLGLIGPQAAWAGGLVTAKCRLHFGADSLDLGRPSLGLGMSAHAGLYRCMFPKPWEAEPISQYWALRPAGSFYHQLELSGFGVPLKGISLFSLYVPCDFCGVLSPWQTCWLHVSADAYGKAAWQRPITFLIPLKFTKSSLSNYGLPLGEKNMGTLSHVFLFR